MNQHCKECNCSFEITEDDLAFYARVSPRFQGKTYQIPPPTRCPDCRQQRRLALCNERHLYPGKCALCKKGFITEFPPEKNKIIYCRDCWHSDQWDPCDSGKTVDFSRPIFDQLQELWEAIPAQNLNSEGTNENSDYIHYAGFAKNCYFIAHADFCEDCYYGYGFKKNISCVDGFYNLSCELCYDCVDVHKSYDLIHCQDCLNCSCSAFLRDCIGCKDCFLCVGLRDQEYCFENEKLSKEEYLRRRAAVDLGSFNSYQECQTRLATITAKHLFKEFHGYNVQNCSGDYISNCKDTHQSFDCEDVEGGKFLYQVVTGAKSNYDIFQYGLNLNESYECSVAGNNCYHILFSHSIHVNCSDLYYCWFLQSSKNCFGCVGMHHKEYCILNKQYSRDQYETLVPKIIEHMSRTGEWGELFPISFSPFGYNRTSADLYFPLPRETVLSKGWRWDDSPLSNPEHSAAISPEEISDSIDDISDDVVRSAIRCAASGRLFRVTSPELKFYRTHRVPLPRLCPDQRHIERFKRRNPRRFWQRPCAICSRIIRTTYDPVNGEHVGCCNCYMQALY